MTEDEKRARLELIISMLCMQDVECLTKLAYRLLRRAEIKERDNVH